jgi:hypothetical protein
MNIPPLLLQKELAKLSPSPEQLAKNKAAAEKLLNQIKAQLDSQYVSSTTITRKSVS